MTPQAAFEALNRTAGIAPLAMPEFEGAEPVLPTLYRGATAAAAALAFGASVAAEIWRFRGGDKQLVSIDLKAAAAALQPYRVARRNGSPLPAFSYDTPAVGFYQSADGRWLYLQGGFPHLAKRTLDLLNADDSVKSVLDSVARWNALALEDALGFMKLCGAMVRTEEEWKAGVQGRVTGAPIVLKKIGDSPPARLKDSGSPLGGMRVLDLSREIAGPACSRLLAQYGADVLAIKNPRLPQHAERDIEWSAGTRRAELDLAKPADAEILRRLARDADIFVDAFRPGALAGLGFSPAALAHAAPGMIYVSISAFGPDGPWAARRGWEETVQAATGLAHEQGAFLAPKRKQRQPEFVVPGTLSVLTGALAAAGAAAAMLKRIREGGAWQVHVSLAATAQWLQSLGRIDAGRVPDAYEPQPGLDQYLQSCETKDGRLAFLGPVVRMSKTPPLRLALPDRFDLPSWTSVHEEGHAAEIQSVEA